MKDDSQAEEIAVADNVALFPTVNKVDPPASQLTINLAEAEKTHMVWSVSLVDLGHEALRLSHPLIVQIEEYESEFIASWPEVEAWGSGDNEASAINALKDALVALHDDLADLADEELGKLPLRWKRAINAVVVGN